METTPQAPSAADSGAVVSPGLHCYIGAPGAGKTHLAIRQAIALASSQRRGLVVIDSGGATNLREIPELKTVAFGETIDNQLRAARGRIVRIIPRDESEFEEVIGSLDRTGQVVILIDEASFWASNPAFLRLCRVWRHRDISLFLTTQKVGRDLEQTILACSPVLRIFRCTAPRTLEYLERWHGLAPASVRALKVGEHYTLSET